MDDFMKTEAKDIISTAIEKASGATGINVEVSKDHIITKRKLIENREFVEISIQI